jgi:3',5'-cyclic AMP phosphodiesterase CpdA
MLIAQVSDTHFGTEVPLVLSALEHLLRTQRPDLMILSGDITQRATPVQFRAARAFVRRNGCPCLAIPGNHDIPLFNVAMRLLAPYSRYRKVFGECLEPVHRSSGCVVIGVRTTRRMRHTDGEVSRVQIARVSALLRQAMSQQLRLVVVHHPVFVNRPEDRHNLLIGHQEAIHEWAAAGADLILGGHIHLPYVAALHEEPSIGALSRRLWTAQAGTAVSSRLRRNAPNSINLLRVAGADGSVPACRVERWDFSAAKHAFQRADETELVLER